MSAKIEIWHELCPATFNDLPDSIFRLLGLFG